MTKSRRCSWNAAVAAAAVALALTGIPSTAIAGQETALELAATHERSRVGSPAEQLRPAFRRTAGIRAQASVDGTVLIQDEPVPDVGGIPTGGTVISPTGVLTRVAPPRTGCPTVPLHWPVVGNGTVLYDCSTSSSVQAGDLQVLTPPSPTWTTLPSSVIDSVCIDLVQGGGNCSILAVGRDWVEAEKDFSHSGPGQGNPWVLVNRATGAVTPDQTTGNVIANLNARLPSQRRCGSLNARRGDLVRFVGRLALVENPASRWATIQSCHSRRFQKLSNEAAVGAHAIVWTTNASRIVHAINAQTGHAFAITIPHQLRGQISGVAITNKKLYVSGDDSDPQVWSARVPSGLSSNG